MIDFKGYLTGKTEKHYHKRNKLFSWILMTAALLALLPGTISISITIKMYILLIINVFGLVIVPLITLIPDSKKTRKEMTPKRITFEDGVITCVADKYVEQKTIDSVKLVRDYGDFYELVFPFGNISMKFICQKDLLVSGSIEEFEALFEGKIVRIK